MLLHFDDILDMPAKTCIREEFKPYLNHGLPLSLSLFLSLHHHVAGPASLKVRICRALFYPFLSYFIVNVCQCSYISIGFFALTATEKNQDLPRSTEVRDAAAC